MNKLTAIFKKNLFSFLFFQLYMSFLFAQNGTINQLKQDWLLDGNSYHAKVIVHQNNIELNNGLLRRRFTIAPNLACYDFVNLSTHQQLIRSVRPEAKLIIDGKEYFIGGLRGQKENGYLKEVWLKDFTVGATDFIFKDYKISEIQPYLHWKKSAWSLPVKKATGKELTLVFVSLEQSLKNIEVQVKYELFDGIPLLVKSLSVFNHSDNSIHLNKVVSESLGIVEEENSVVGKPDQMQKQHGIYFETNYAFNNAMRYQMSDQTTHWLTDSTYTSQVNYDMNTPCVVEVFEDQVKEVEVQPGTEFQSVRTNELLMDSYDRTRRGLMIQKMYAMLAPWVLENPIFMHLVSKNDQQVFTAIDQCAATGYEALILSFGSHLNMEDSSADNINRWKKIAEYAHSKNILIGGYSLFSSRTINPETDIIDPKTGKPGRTFFGHAPCFGSKWGLGYSQSIKTFFAKTGFNIWENDGPYPGDICGSTTHPGHKNADDSQWAQMAIQKELYHWLKERGIYINAPDWYFLDGTNKIALGYKEKNFSLSRSQQMILNRQNICDGTKEKLPSMNWGFVPLTVYQGGDKDAWLEPLSEHLKDYEQLMVQYYGAGVQACYRGFRLYDTEATKQKVIEIIKWYKKYREILNSPMVQLRRADGRDWDGFIHVNPDLKTKGFLLVFNPTNEEINRKITAPLYYTGLKKTALVTDAANKIKIFNLDCNSNLTMNVSIPANGYAWFTIK